MDNRTITEKLADFALDLSYKDIPELGKIKAKEAIIDYLGCILGAADTPEAAVIDHIVAAMAAGILLELNRDQLVWALGNAGTMAAGLWQFNLDGAMSKYLHCAKAASDGLLAAVLAKQNYTGPRKIIEGEKGFMVSHSEEKNPERFFETLGSEFMIDMLSIKPFPSCSHTHAAISAALQLKQKYDIMAEEIEKIIITTYKDALVTARNNEKFTTSREAKFSISGGTAAALQRGKVDKNTFSAKAIADPELLALVAKTEIVIDDEMTKNYPNQWAAAVEVQTARGSFRMEEKEPWGDLRDPMPLGTLKVKYTQLAEGVLDNQKTEILWDRCLDLENLDDVNQMFAGI